jgi:hypothetical protein
MKIICTAKIANTTVGHIDHAMAYAVGLQQLGHEVYLMEQVGSNRCIDAKNQPVPFQQWSGLQHFERVAKAYGVWPRACLIYKQGEASHGMTFPDAVKIAKECDLLITRSGQIHKAPEIFENAKCRAYFDGNPGKTQFLFHDQGENFEESLHRYDSLFTLGLNIGTEHCPISVGAKQWHTNMRPIVLSMWPSRIDSNSQRFTTISSWNGRTSFEWQGQNAGEKSDNWLNFLHLPKHVNQELEIALKMDSDNPESDQARFSEQGWHLSNPEKFSTFDDYKNYIGQSRAEFSVAHNRYVTFKTGWFSDRSAVYLASGKPVLVQATGIEDHLPTGKGLLTYTTFDEAAAGIDAINCDYLNHCHAARDIAEAYFDANKVLPKILKQIGC